MHRAHVQEMHRELNCEAPVRYAYILYVTTEEQFDYQLLHDAHVTLDCTILELALGCGGVEYDSILRQHALCVLRGELTTIVRNEHYYFLTLLHVFDQLESFL